MTEERWLPAKGVPFGKQRRDRLTNEERDQILALAGRYSRAELARQFGKCYETVARLLRGATYKLG